MQDWIINVMNQFGYLGITLLILIENIFPPIPSEIILIFGGFMTTYTALNVWLVILFATIGSLTGAVILYYIGYLFSPERLGYVIDRWGKVLRLKRQDITRAEDWFNKKGSSTVFFCRMIPVLRSLISIPAGMSRMKIGKFLGYTILGSAIWNVILVNLGAYAGENWTKIVHYMDLYSYVAYILMGIAAVIFLVWYLKKSKTRKIQ